MYEQLKNYFNKILSKYQYRFKKGLLGMEVVVVEGGRGQTVPATLLTDLSKAFDCLSHDVSIAKPNAYGIKKEKGL